MGMFESLLFCERETNSREIDFFCSAFICLAVLAATTFNDLFDVGVVKTLVIADLTILYISMRYWMQT